LAVPLHILTNEVRVCWLVLLLLTGFAACSSSPPTIDTRTIDVQVSPNANQDAAVALDIVYVFNPQLLTQLQMLGARDWFKQRDQFRALYPTEVDVSSYELVPGQRGPIEQVAGRHTDAIGVFAFANYHNEGAHRARLDRLKNVVLRLNDDDLAVAPVS